MSFINTNEINTIIKYDYRYRLLLNIPCKMHHVEMTYVRLKINVNASYLLRVTNLGLEIRVDRVVDNSSIMISRDGDLRCNLRVNLAFEQLAIINKLFIYNHLFRYIRNYFMDIFFAFVFC